MKTFVAKLRKESKEHCTWFSKKEMCFFSIMKALIDR